MRTLLVATLLLHSCNHAASDRDMTFESQVRGGYHKRHSARHRDTLNTPSDDARGELGAGDKPLTEPNENDLGNGGALTGGHDGETEDFERSSANKELGAGDTPLSEPQGNDLDQGDAPLREATDRDRDGLTEDFGVGDTPLGGTDGEDRDSANKEEVSSVDDPFVGNERPAASLDGGVSLDGGTQELGDGDAPFGGSHHEDEELGNGDAPFGGSHHEDEEFGARDKASTGSKDDNLGDGDALTGGNEGDGDDEMMSSEESRWPDMTAASPEMMSNPDITAASPEPSRWDDEPPELGTPAAIGSAPQETSAPVTGASALVQTFYGNTKKIADHVTNMVGRAGHSIETTKTEAGELLRHSDNYDKALRDLSAGLKSFKVGVNSFREVTAKKHADNTKALGEQLQKGLQAGLQGWSE